MTKDDCFDVIDKDNIIKLIGKQIFDCRRPNKIKESKIKARNAMRRLAKLVMLTENVQGAFDLFTTLNCANLENAIHRMCTDSDTSDKPLKAGLNLALGTLIKKSCRLLIPHFLIQQQKDKANVVKDFLDVFSSPSYYARLFSGAEYQLREKRQRENRKPNALPQDKDICSLVEFLEQEILTVSATGINKKSDFVRIRRAVVAYVTLFNAKRGSEVTRLQIKDWEEKSSWITPDSVDDTTANLVQRYSVTFVMGKGDGLIPVIFPNKCAGVIDMLSTSKIRNMAGVSDTNYFLFPYTEQSEDCSIGYNEIMLVCQKMNIPIITATSMRHRASTKLWEMEGIDESSINVFMEHMGHQKDIDKNIYACPPALNILKRVTPILERINPTCAPPMIGASNKGGLEVSCQRQADDKIQVSCQSQADDKIQDRTRWTDESTTVVINEFKDYISGEKECSYPGKREIQRFQNSCSMLAIKEMAWLKIKTKVFNEKQKLKGALKKLES